MLFLGSGRSSCGGNRLESELGLYLFVQLHVAVLVHRVQDDVLAGSFAGTDLNVDIHLTEETKSYTLWFVCPARTKTLFLLFFVLFLVLFCSQDITYLLLRLRSLYLFRLFCVKFLNPHQTTQENKITLQIIFLHTPSLQKFLVSGHLASPGVLLGGQLNLEYIYM